ncbi:MAG: TIGR04086 family membrane protein [Thermoanaerobacterales bacterium]|nr:TIGR04086 family membrane protein [Thermoanaerobacterales bacterium]
MLGIEILRDIDVLDRFTSVLGPLVRLSRLSTEAAVPFRPPAPVPGGKKKTYPGLARHNNASDECPGGECFMAFNNETPRAGLLNWQAVGRGLLLAVLGVIALSLFASVVFYFSSLSEALLPWATSFAIFFGVAFGASAASRQAGGKGLWHGLAVGLGFFLLTLFVSAFILSEPLTLLGIGTKLLLTASAGVLGGIFGVTA